MNILIFNWRDPNSPKSGGAEIVTMEHAKAWIRSGHKVTLFSSFYKGAKKKEVIGGVTVIRYGNEAFQVQLLAFFWYMFGDHDKFDLIVDQFHGIPFFTPLYVRAKKLAFIHEVTKNVWKLNPWPKPFNLIPSFFGPIFEPLIFKKIYKNVPFMTVSKSTEKDLIEWEIRREHIHVIYSGYNLPKDFSLPEKEKKKTIIFLGALAEDKGVEDAIKAFSLIKGKDTEWQFWVVGKGDKNYKKKLFDLSEQLQVDNIKFWGYVSDNKKFNLLARAHVLVNPSVREGWGLVNIEANAVGTPVVAYDVAGCSDSIKNDETGILVILGNYKGLAESIITLVNNASLYNKLRRNALGWSKKFSWEKATKKSLTLINKNYILDR